MSFRAEVAWPRPGNLTDDQIDTFGPALPGNGALIDDGAVYLYARFDLDTDDPEAAAQQAVTVARAAYTAVFGQPADPVQIAVYPATPGLVPGPIDLVGLADVAAILGVSRQRAHQLVDRLPAPTGSPSGTPAWVRAVVEQVIASPAWHRKPGRPASVG